MRIKANISLAIVGVIFLASICNGEEAKSASEFIKLAHNYDNMYITGPEASQQKAISFYELALKAEPDSKEQLHILCRMAQLYGSSYDRSKGEKPDFHKAIEFNKKIISEYPPQEPLVYKAMNSICDHYTTLRDFDNAIKWSKKAIEYRPSEMVDQLKSGEIDEKNADKIKRYQRIAVEQIAYTADRISYLQTHGELRAIVENYAGTFISQRAKELLVENMEKMPYLWMPATDDPFSPVSPALQAAVSAPATHNQTHGDILIQSESIAESLQRQASTEPNTTEKPQNYEHVTKESRASPVIDLRKYTILTAGLIVLAIAVYFKKRR